jgi:predicted ATPase
MITRIEIDGFKSFHEFRLELSPFQVIIGANGSGKSNLFDALRLLSRLARMPVNEAFQDRQGRGDAFELFSVLASGEIARRMRLVVELLVDPVRPQGSLHYTRFRYEVVIEVKADAQGLEQLVVTYESLVSIPRSQDHWYQRYLATAPGAAQRPASPDEAQSFISTSTEGGQVRFNLFSDHISGIGQPMLFDPLPVHLEDRTVLSSVGSVPVFPHAGAVQAELSSMQFLLQLDPDVLRLPGRPTLRRTARLGSDGRGLTDVLARMEAEDPRLLNDVSYEVANLVPGIQEILLKKDATRDEYALWAKTQDGQLFSARVLSDGTLRLLALITLKNDPRYRGVLGLEEPENGVHPFRLKYMAHLLHGLATDFSDPDQLAEPLRQVLINTHSPILVSELSKASPGKLEIVFAYMVTRLPGGTRVTRMVPVTRDPQLREELEIAEPEEAYTWKQVRDYLDSANTGDAVAVLGENQG